MGLALLRLRRDERLDYLEGAEILGVGSGSGGGGRNVDSEWDVF